MGTKILLNNVLWALMMKMMDASLRCEVSDALHCMASLFVLTSLVLLHR